MILLDTNIVSEVWRVRPDPRVLAWLDAQPPERTFICTPVLAELRYGAELMEPGRRRLDVERAIEALRTRQFAGRVLPFDQPAALHAARIRANARREGAPLPILDALIAAIAMAHGCMLATRNVVDLARTGIPLINPFDVSETA